MALDWNAGRIDNVTFDAARLQRAADPERVLADFVADDGAHASDSDHFSLCASIGASAAYRRAAACGSATVCTAGRSRRPSCSANFYFAAASSSDTANTASSPPVVNV
nr:MULTISPECIES: hypothetical protein [unclassified Caballeronia]